MCWYWEFSIYIILMQTDLLYNIEWRIEYGGKYGVGKI